MHIFLQKGAEEILVDEFIPMPKTRACGLGVKLHSRWSKKGVSQVVYHGKLYVHFTRRMYHK